MQEHEQKLDVCAHTLEQSLKQVLVAWGSKGVDRKKNSRQDVEESKQYIVNSTQQRQFIASVCT